MKKSQDGSEQTVPLDSLVGPCPLCGTPNNDDWPIEVAGEIVQGGCQECWDKQSDAAWWKMVVAVDTLQANTELIVTKRKRRYALLHDMQALS